MGRLSMVNEEMATKLLSEVEYGQHIEGTKMTPMTGGTTSFICSLKEVLSYLFMSSTESLSIMGGMGIIGYVDLDKLKNWVNDTFGDQELATAIGEEIEKGSCYADRVGPIRQLIEERLQQCKALLPSKENESGASL